MMILEWWNTYFKTLFHLLGYPGSARSDILKHRVSNLQLRRV